MSNNTKNLTIFLTLYDRHEYTQRWIDFNWDTGFEYVIADGSSKKSNFEIFENNNKENIKYIYAGEDKSVRDYLKKILICLENVKTKYVMFVDNDDLIVKKNIKNITNILESKEEYIGAHGLIGSIYEKNNKFNKPIIEKNTCERLTNIYGIEAIKKCVNNYNYLHYAIIRTSIQKKIFENLLKSSCNNFYQAENFHTFLALSYGKFLWIPKLFYIRQRNPKDSNSLNDLKKNYENPLYDFILTKEYEVSYSNLCEIIAQNSLTSFDEIYTLIRKLYIREYINIKPNRIETKFNLLRNAYNIIKYRYSLNKLNLYLNKYYAKNNKF